MDTSNADVGQLIATPRGDFYVERTGPEDGPTIVFVSAFGDDHTTWAEVTPSLAPSYDCITFDNRGIGQSPMTGGPYSIAELAEDVHQLVGALGADPVIAIGSSMGSAVCQEWTLAHPEAVTHLVLTNTWAERDPWLSSLFDHWIDLA
jgi:3-oxoadipate enol-lactonase